MSFDSTGYILWQSLEKEEPVAESRNVKVDHREEVAVVTIDRPKVLNALNSATLEELKGVLWELWNDEGCAGVVLTGAGEKAFIGGADISEMANLDAKAAKRFSELGHTVCRMLEGMPKPVIAAVNGYALGGGTEVALACDIILASDRAVFGQPEVNLGLVPGFGGTARLPRAIGRWAALEWILSGQMYGAEEAFRLGLVSKVVQADALLDEALALARTIASRGPRAVVTAKSLIHNGLSVPLEHALETEKLAFAWLFASEEPREGMNAFLEKRKPRFKRT